MSKITTKHYLNKRLKAIDDRYPIYVRVVFNRQNTNFPTEMVSVKEANDSEFLNSSIIRNEISYEVRLIDAIINFTIDNNINNFTTKNIVKAITVWKDAVLDILSSETYDLVSLKRSIIDHIMVKTAIDRKVLNKAITINQLEYSDYHSLMQSIEFGKSVKNFIELGYYLEKFEAKYFLSTESPAAGVVLNYFEWINNDMSSKFRDYFLKHTKISSEEAISLLHEFNTILKKHHVSALSEIIKS